MSLPDGERCLRPPQSLVVSLLLSLVSTLVFSRTGGVLSLQSILTHRFPQFPLRNLCSLVMLAVSSLVCAAMDTAFFYVPISPGLAESRILLAAPVDTRPRTSLISFCTVQLRTLCAAHSLATLCLSMTSGAPWSSAMPPSLGRGRVNNNNNKVFVIKKKFHCKPPKMNKNFCGEYFSQDNIGNVNLFTLLQTQNSLRV